MCVWHKVDAKIKSDLACVRNSLYTPDIDFENPQSDRPINKH